MNMAPHLLLLMALMLLSGCSSATLKKAEQDGKTLLESRQIFDLVSGNTMNLTAYDFEARVFFDENGKLGGIDNENMRDTGTWDIKDNNQLCLKFMIWYYGDVNCYSVVSGDDDKRFAFFSPNGAAYYTGLLQQGDPGGLGKRTGSKKSSQYLRQKLAAEKQGATNETSSTDNTAQSAPSQRAELSSPAISTQPNGSIRRLARNCPGCNLAGANLKEADLVNADLQGANLSDTDLRYANLRRAKLAGANLSGSRLNHANLPGADLSGCNLRNADLSGANLLLTDLTGADLTGAVLTRAHLKNTKGL